MRVILSILIAFGSINYSQAQWGFQPQFSARCVNPNGRSGTCVSIYDCQTILAVLQRKPLQTEDYEFTKNSECQAGYGKAPYVCCTSDTGFTRNQYEDVDYTNDFWGAQVTPVTAATKRTFLFPTDEGSFSNRKRSRRVNAVTATTNTNSLIPQAPTCGGIKIQNKILGGANAELNEFPWMVQFEYTRKSGEISVNCGGSLINQRYVLTAAHCLSGAIIRVIGKLIAIRLGEHDTSQQIDCNNHICSPEALRVGFEQLIPHEHYNDKSSNKENDIGLVRLDRNIRYSNAIKPICLPSVLPTEKIGKQFTVAGWGKTLKSSKSPIKQKLIVNLVDQQKCAKKFAEKKVKIVESQMCAGGNYAEDSCEGDSGGPLMRIQNGAWVLEGIVSFGYKCGLRDWPAVHTRVSSYDNWIRSNIRG